MRWPNGARPSPRSASATRASSLAASAGQSAIAAGSPNPEQHPGEEITEPGGERDETEAPQAPVRERQDESNHTQAQEQEQHPPLELFIPGGLALEQQLRRYGFAPLDDGEQRPVLQFRDRPAMAQH